MVSDNYLVISAYGVLARASVSRAIFRCAIQKKCIVIYFLFYLFCYYLDQQMHNI